MAKRKTGFNYWNNNEDDYDDYVPYGSKSSSKSKSSKGYSGYYRGYSGYSGYSGWNWGSFGSYKIQEEDDDGKLYVKAHDSYLTPSSTLIGTKFSTYQENTQKNRDIIKEFARFFYHRMIDEKDYFQEKFKDTSKLDEEEIEKFRQKQAYYEELWDKFIPGMTPLEQAFALYEELRRKQSKDGITPSQINEESLERDITGLEFHEEIYTDPIFNELVDMQPLAKEHKMDILNKLSMIKNLGSEFKIEKDIEDKIVQNSRLISKKVMRDYDQIHQVDLYQRLMPTFKTKLLTKDLIINTPIDRTEHKQKIIILVDYSGSMGEDEKQLWVLAVMIDRIKYAIKEEAEIFFSFFVDRPELLRFTHIHNRKSAMDFWISFSTHPNGGDTRLGDMINTINNEINVKHKLCNLNIDLSEDKPEVLAINDGQDSVKTDGFTYKTNAITVIDKENSELKKLCLANKGKYVYATTSGVKTYDAGNR